MNLLRFCASHGVRLPDCAAWHVVERVLAALAYAHAQTDERHALVPIVHRDVSPANVLVDWKGDVKLADFGMAKMLGASPATRLGVVKGTLGCMAPEQARGEPVTERADVYAAALLAWRLSRRGARRSRSSRTTRWSCSARCATRASGRCRRSALICPGRCSRRSRAPSSPTRARARSPPTSCARS